MDKFEYNYHVIIEKNGTGKDTKIAGTLTSSFCKYNNSDIFPTEESTQIEFNPLIILGDVKGIKTIYLYPSKRLNADNSQQKSKVSYNFEFGFEKEHMYINDEEQYFAFVSELNKIVKENNCKTLSDLEKIRNSHKIELDCKIAIKEPNIYFESLQKKNLKAEKDRYVPLNYEFGKVNDKLSKKTYMKKDYQFYYHCHTMSEVIFAVLHFIVIHEYEFRTCALCQKIYAKIPNNGQGKYCSRKSPLESELSITGKSGNIGNKFKGLNCQESMSKFREIIRNMKKNRLNCISDEEKEYKYKFENEFNEYSKSIELASSPVIENLEKLYLFVKNYKFEFESKNDGIKK